MSRAQAASSLVVLCVSCVTVIDLSEDSEAGGSGGTSIATASGTGGSAPGGGGGEGGSSVPDPGPVPGCEALVWLGDPIRIDGELPSVRGFVRLDGSEVGLVFEDRDLPDLVVFSTVIDAFGAGPPGVGKPVEHRRGRPMGGGVPGLSSARADGHFALPLADSLVVGVAGQPGTVTSYAPGRLYVEPEPGAGAYRAAVTAGQALETHFEHFPTLSPDAAPTSMGLLQTPICGGWIDALAMPDSLLVFRGAASSCPEPVGHVEMWRVDATGLQHLSSFTAPFVGEKYAVLPRDGGGAWLGVSAGASGIVVYPIDPATGAVLGVPWTGMRGFDSAPEIAVWGDGFVAAGLDVEGVSVVVSDGVNATAASVLDVQTFGQTAAIVGSAAGDSVLVAYWTLDGDDAAIELARADCVSVE